MIAPLVFLVPCNLLCATLRPLPAVRGTRRSSVPSHGSITCTACCIPSPPTPPAKCLPSYTGVYLDGPLAGHTTFNASAVGDMLSATGTYANFADDSGKVSCPAPFALVLEDDTNVALVTYGASYGTPCGDYTGDSARYYRKSLVSV